MKSLKKTLVLLVVFSMILSTLVPAFAATDVDGLDCEDQVTRMEALGIIKGFEDGTFRPTETITRAQMAVIICKMTGVTDAIANANKNVDSKFSDVKAGEWYTGYVNIASNNGIITGFPDGTFRPNETLTLNQVLTLCVKALGRGGYVDKMGTWPANYIAEAARLNLLKDVKGASDANRGNVAVICWNTLNSKTWYVTSEKLDGEVSLGKDAQTLLAINFVDFTTTDGEFKEIEDIDITKTNINDRQLKLPAKTFGDTEKEIKTFDFSKKPSKNKDEKSYRDGEDVFVFVPEEVCEDLDELRNKTITLILGTDNVAALVLVQDDVVETAFLTKYDEDAHKITIDGTTYKIRMNGQSEDLDVTVNDCEYKNVENGDDIGFATLSEALAAMGVDDFKKIEKAIEATITLDEDDKVEAIDMLVSAEVKDTAATTISTEVLVTKVKETNSKYTIYTTGKNITWNIDDEDDLDFPKVYVDRKKADIRDIEAGSVLTLLFEEDASEIEYDVLDISKIYASTKSATGEATKVKKSNNAITLDGEVYMATKLFKDSDKVMSTDELKDNKFTEKFDAQKVLDNDEVTLYLNMFGEYVAITLDEANTDYTFGIVTFISSNITWEGDDEEIAVRNIKVLLPDGKKTTYKLTVDTDDDDIDDTVKDAVQARDFDMFKEGDFIMFEAKSDRRIEIEKTTDVKALSDTTTTGKIGTTDYVITGWKADSVNKDDEEFTATYDTDKTISAEYDSKTTVIFNRTEKEIVSKWKSILKDGDDTNFADKTFAIFKDKDEDTPLYIVVAISENDYSSSDATYAIVERSAYQTKDTYYVDFVDEENVEIKDGVVENLKKINGWLVEYAMSSSKISSAFKLIDVEEIQSGDTKDSTTLADLIDKTTNAKKETVLLVEDTYRFEQIELDEVKITTSGKITLKFVKTGDNDKAINDVKLDKDEITVYDLRNGKVAKVDIKDVQKQVADGDALYVIPAYNADADYANDGANLLFIVK